MFPKYQDGQFWFAEDIFLHYTLFGGIVDQSIVKHGLSVSLHAGFGQLRYGLPVNLASGLITEYPGTPKTPTELFPDRGFGSLNLINITPVYGAFHINFFTDTLKKYVPSVFVGLGLLSFSSHDENGNSLPRKVAGEYGSTTLLLPMGVGFEAYIDDNLAVNANLSLFVTGTDYLDDVKNFGDGPGTPNDCFMTLGAGITYYFLGDPDTDGDGLSDRLERQLGTDPNNPDTDGDGLTDGQEYITFKTDPVKADTDGDGLSDGDEVRKYKTNPLKPDTDGDGLSDGEEILTYKTFALIKDTDGDGLSDYDEVKTYKTNPLKPDTDGDGLTDGNEVNNTKTDPLNPDTDGDGFRDNVDKCPLVAGVAPDGCPHTAAAPAPVVPEIPQKLVKGTKVNFPGVLFIASKDNFDLTQPSTMENLLKIKELLNQCDEISVNIEGHSSSEGNAKTNQKLSEDRAIAVKKWMVEQGVAEKKIAKTIGYGSTKLAVPEPKGKNVSKDQIEAARKQNRRITISVVDVCK